MDLQKYFQHSPFFVGSTTISDSAWERLQDKIDRLPPALANLLTDFKTSDFVERLTQKHIQLSVQGPDVARLIRDTVIGDIFIGDMPQEIANRLGVDQTLAREVANQIISQLFTSVLEDIRKVQNIKFSGRLPAKPFPSTAPQVRPVQPPISHYEGEGLPESGGNIIDLRNK